MNKFINYCCSIVCRHDNMYDDSTFEKFLLRRNKEKESLYFTVFLTGFLVLVAGATINGISAIYPEDSIEYGVESILGSFGRVFGFCMISVIPVSEFDLIEKMVDPRNYYLRFVIVLALLVFTIATCASNSNSQFFSGVATIAVIASILMIISFKRKITYRLFQFIFNFGISIFGIAICFLQLDTYYKVNDIFAFYSALIWLLFAFVAKMIGVNDWRCKRFEFSCNFSFSPDESDIYRKIDLEEHWGGKSVYSIIYAMFFLQMIVLFLRAIGYALRGKDVVALYWFLAGVADIVPMTAVLVFGEKRCFSLLARYYEYDIERLQKDGACLSQLVSNSISSQSSGDRIFWIFRKEKSKKYDQLMSSIFKDKKHKPIDKAFWMKGTPYQLPDEKQKEDIEGKVVEYEGIKVSYADDVGTYYCFQGYIDDKNKHSSKLTGHELIYDKENVIDADTVFKEWVNSNFNLNNLIESSPKQGYVVIRRQKEIVKSKSKEVLIEWANKHMRKLEWGNHSKRLLKRLLRQSPRDIGSAFTCENCSLHEKERLYNLTTSVPRIKLEHQKIDFFVSHSWEDDYSQKWEALKAFSEKFFVKNKRYPTLWLDKVCIDQRDTSQALEVLPINIASSKKMLVVMSNTYIERLWCVWELFTLFSFCSKELAVDRLEIIFLKPKSSNSGKHEIIDEPVDEKKMIEKIRNLAHDKISPIDSSHCFGPEEEYKLRSIMNDIGLENLTLAFGQIARALEDKSKMSIYDHLTEKLSKILFSTHISLPTSNNSASIKPVLTKTD